MEAPGRERVRCTRATVTCCLTPCGRGLRICRNDNAAALLAGLENQWPERIGAQLVALRRRLDAPELAPLWEVMLRWTQHLGSRRNRLGPGGGSGHGRDRTDARVG